MYPNHIIINYGIVDTFIEINYILLVGYQEHSLPPHPLRFDLTKFILPFKTRLTLTYNQNLPFLHTLMIGNIPFKY